MVHGSLAHHVFVTCFLDQPVHWFPDLPIHSLLIPGSLIYNPPVPSIEIHTSQIPGPIHNSTIPGPPNPCSLFSGSASPLVPRPANPWATDLSTTRPLPVHSGSISPCFIDHLSIEFWSTDHCFLILAPHNSWSTNPCPCSTKRIHWFVAHFSWIHQSQVHLQISMYLFIYFFTII